MKLGDSSVPGKSQRSRETLLAAAIEVFGDKGPRGATVREIAALAGQNVASIAYYFGSKEQLYHAVVEWIAAEIRSRIGHVVLEARTRLEEGSLNSEEALRLLKRFCRSIFEQILRRRDALPIARIIVREQTSPSSAFEILYQQSFLPMHQALCALVGRALGVDPRKPELMLRAHMILGQVFVFMMTREAILRRLNWPDFDQHKAELIPEVVNQHIDLLLGQPSKSLS